MIDFEFIKIEGLENKVKIRCNSFFSLTLTMEELSNFSNKLIDFLNEHNNKKEFVYLRNRKTGRLEKIYDTENE